MFRVAVDGLEEPAILKLNRTDHEVMHPYKVLLQFVLWLPSKAFFFAERSGNYKSVSKSFQWFQEMMLECLYGVPHVVQLVVSSELTFESKRWRAILLQPFGRLLERSDAPRLIARVVCDVAQAISGCAKRGIVHQDVKPGNFVEYKQQGYLCDFNAAKVAPRVKTFTIMLACLRGN